MTKVKILLFSLISFVLLLSAVSADTLVTGQVYNAEYGSVVSGADVLVVCEGVVKTAVTKNNGIYAAVFSNTDCPINSGVNVKVTTSDGKSGSDEVATVESCDSENCTTDLIAVANVVILPPSASSGGGSSNSRRSSGGAALSTPSVSATNNAPIIVVEEPQETLEQTTNSAPITGGIIGALGKAGTLIVVFIVVILALAIVLYVLKGSRRSEKFY